ncbi:unnamed protein product [Closterium sp. Yama58-4]|nr:unnamed protein product [Closterium sp. Yama58-4]
MVVVCRPSLLARADQGGREGNSLWDKKTTQTPRLFSTDGCCDQPLAPAGGGWLVGCVRCSAQEAVAVLRDMGSMSDVKKGYVDTEAGQIHYRRCGHGPPSILLLHSAAQSSAMFTSALKRMGAAGLHAIALDLPNSGESCRAASTCADPTQAAQLPSGELTMVDVANLVLQAAHALRFAPPFDIVSADDMVGHEAGATVAIHIAAELPHIVRRLVLWGVPMLGFMERGDALREETPDGQYDSDLPAAVSTFLHRRFPDGGVPWQLKVRTLIDMLQTYERRPWLSRAMAVVDHAELLKRVHTPVLCMAGESEPLHKATRKAALLCKNGEYVDMGAAGRDVVDELPDDYTSVLLQFLFGEPAPAGPTERASCSVPAGDVAGAGGDRHMSDSAMKDAGGRPLQKHLSHSDAQMGRGPGGLQHTHAHGHGRAHAHAQEHAHAHARGEAEQREGGGEIREAGQQGRSHGTSSSSMASSPVIGSMASSPVTVVSPSSRSSNDSEERRTSGEKRTKDRIKSFFRGKSTV